MHRSEIALQACGAQGIAGARRAWHGRGRSSSACRGSKQPDSLRNPHPCKNWTLHQGFGCSPRRLNVRHVDLWDPVRPILMGAVAHVIRLVVQGPSGAIHTFFKVFFIREVGVSFAGGILHARITWAGQWTAVQSWCYRGQNPALCVGPENGGRLHREGMIGSCWVTQEDLVSCSGVCMSSLRLTALPAPRGMIILRGGFSAGDADTPRVHFSPCAMHPLVVLLRNPPSLTKHFLAYVTCGDGKSFYPTCARDRTG